MKKIVHKSAAPIYAAAVVWLLYGLLFPLYRIIHFVIVIAASAVVYFIAKALCPDIVEEVKVEEKPQTTTVRKVVKPAPKPVKEEDDGDFDGLLDMFKKR